MKTGAKVGGGSSAANSKSRRSHSKTAELIHVLLLFIALFLTIALVGYDEFQGPHSDATGRDSGLVGQFGQDVAGYTITFTFGRYGAFAVPLFILLMLITWWSGGRFKPWRWLIGVVFLGFFTGFAFALYDTFQGVEPVLDRCGILPLRLFELSLTYLQLTGTTLAAATLAILIAILLLNVSLLSFLSAIFYRIPARVVRGIGSIASSSPAKTPKTAKSTKKKAERLPPGDAPVFPNESGIERDSSTAGEKENNWKQDSPIDVYSGPIAERRGPRQLPPLNLLDTPPHDRPSIESAELEGNSHKLEEKLKNLGIQARVVRTIPGPVITRYDLEPDAQVKIARIASLADDIAMALRARGVRILAPVPGEATVGIEIPNRTPATVYMQEVVASYDFRRHTGPLTIALGKDASGSIFCTDLAKMPHLLIAGATGSGKSVCINVVITSLLYRADPDEVRLVLIDPKKLELSLYARLNEHHLVAPPGLSEDVVTSAENAVRALQSVHAEMERRYDILADAGVRGLDEYNRWIEATKPTTPDEKDVRERLPYLVVIIDELADLMMVVRREFEDLVARLAQMSRAVGIHLVVATQRPSVDVVTGLIKANFPARIAFQVASKFDSRTIIDGMGAESLLGRGDMLFNPAGSAAPQRLHGALITTEEVERVVEFVKSQPPCTSEFRLPDAEESSVSAKAGNRSSGSEVDDTDDLFEQAAKIVVTTEQGSISMLQRRLRVGYARAARLIDQLEQAGIVGPFDGSKSRDVRVTLEELNERYGIQ